MIKPAIAFLSILLLTGTSFYVSTEIGLRQEGTHRVVVEVATPPSYSAVGQALYSRDGSKLLVNGVTRGSCGGGHKIHATVYGTHRYALALLPARWVHSFSMDRSSVERVLMEASGVAPERISQTVGRRWLVLN